MDTHNFSPEKSFQRNRGVILGPGIGVLAGVVISLFTDAPIGYLAGGCMGVGLLGGAVLDYLRRAAERKAERSASTCRN